jgi:hypothetical protein
MRPISIDNSHTFIAQYPSFRHFPRKFSEQEAAQLFKEQLLERGAGAAYLGGARGSSAWGK